MKSINVHIECTERSGLNKIGKNVFNNVWSNSFNTLILRTNIAATYIASRITDKLIDKFTK